MARRGHGEGSIYQRTDGRWVGCLTLENMKRKYIYGKTRREVQEKLRQALHEQKQGTLATGPQQKLEPYLVNWLETVKKPKVKTGTYVQYQSVVHCHLIPAFGHIAVQKLTPQQVQHFISEKIQEGLAATSIIQMHRVLHSALSNAVKWNMVPRNVAGLVSLPRPEKHEVHPLTIEQANTLLDTMAGHKLEALVFTAITTGMRRGELLALRWDDIDLTTKTLHVKRTVNWYTKYGFVENEPKTKSSNRKILLPDVTIEALMKHRVLQEQQKVKAGDKWQNNNLVFCTVRGTYLDPRPVIHEFRKLVKKAGLPPIRFHDLRHSAATILLMKKVPAKVVQELLGHSKIAITMDIYSHVLPALQQEAMSHMDDAFKRP